MINETRQPGSEPIRLRAVMAGDPSYGPQLPDLPKCVRLIMVGDRTFVLSGGVFGLFRLRGE